MSDQNDDDYMRGYRAAYASMAVRCAGELGGGDPAARLAFLEAERVRTVAALRGVCAEHGDNSWPDTLYLPDVVEKFLARHLDSDDAARDTGEPEAPSPDALRADANEAELRAVERSLRSLVEGWTASGAKWAARSNAESDPEALRWLGWSEGLEHAVLGLCRALGIERPGESGTSDVEAEIDAAAGRLAEVTGGDRGDIRGAARELFRLSTGRPHRSPPPGWNTYLVAEPPGPNDTPAAEGHTWDLDRAETPADRAQQSATLKAAELARRWSRARLNVTARAEHPAASFAAARSEGIAATWRVAIEDLCAAFAIPEPATWSAAPSSAALTSAERYALRRGGWAHGPADGRWTRPAGESQRALFESDPHELDEMRHAAGRLLRAQGDASAPPAEKAAPVDWTMGPDGRASEALQRIVLDVARLIVCASLDPATPAQMADRIVRQLAHVHGLAPRG